MLGVRIDNQDYGRELVKKITLTTDFPTERKTIEIRFISLHHEKIAEIFKIFSEKDGARVKQFAIGANTIDGTFIYEMPSGRYGNHSHTAEPSGLILTLKEE